MTDQVSFARPCEPPPAFEAPPSAAASGPLLAAPSVRAMAPAGSPSATPAPAHPSSASPLFAAPARLRRLQIEVTTGCNLRCAGCQRTLGLQAGTWRNAHMPRSRFAAIVANAPPAESIILQGIGEPTLHPDLATLVATAHESGKFRVISFNTNALLRDTAAYAALRDAGLRHLSISVDSLDPATAEALRAGTDVARLRAAIAELTALFRGAVTLSIVLSRRN
ncbi:MAG: radical SAM protein, partial [Rhodospirillales bacterium]|nr:radical SAM protein [Rhodospirillales bacterium]